MGPPDINEHHLSSSDDGKGSRFTDKQTIMTRGCIVPAGAIKNSLHYVCFSFYTFPTTPSSCKRCLLKLDLTGQCKDLSISPKTDWKR